jgi:DNA mismatch repair protein MutS2
VVNRWVDSVYDGVEDIMPAVVRLTGEMEFYLASFAFKELAESKGLSVGLPEFSSEEDASIEMEGLFNPLLFGQQITPVPCNLVSDRRDAVTVVTGPNSGGKTRLLQAVATLQMLAECGMYASAKRARLHRAAGLFVSLIEEAKADQREGRLGTELIRIRNVFEQSHPDSLVILDELCSGTNPSEGEEIFRLVVSLLAELRPRVFITTHFLKFAQTLAKENTKDSPLRFLRVELDETDQPTFQFLQGVATTSLAHLTAARLGVTRDELLSLVRRNSAKLK